MALDARWNVNKDINLLVPLRRAELFLAKPNKIIISKLNEAYNVELKLKLGAINELNFSIPYEVDYNHILQANKNITLLRDRYFILIQVGLYREWFTINKTTNLGDDEKNEIKVECMSLGYELTDKYVKTFISKSPTNPTDDPKFADPVNMSTAINTVLNAQNARWKLGYVDAVFDTTYRSFSVNSKNVLDYVFEVADTFQGLIKFDTENRLINVYKPENVGVDRGLVINYGHFMKSVEQESHADEMVTRLYCYGKEEISIDEVSITGQPYIDDYSYFRYPFQRDSNGNILSSSFYMSDALCIAIEEYENEVISHNGEYSTILTNLKDVYNHQTEKFSQRDEYDRQMAVLQDKLDRLNATNGKTNDSGTIDYTTEIANTITQKNTLQASIDALQIEIDALNEQIACVTFNINVTTNFSLIGNVTLKIDGNNFEVPIGASDTSLSKIAERINTELNKNIGVFRCVQNNNVVTVKYYKYISQQPIELSFADTTTTGVSVTFGSPTYAGYKYQIDQIRNAIDVTKFFTPSLIDELKQYIIEKEWKDDKYADSANLMQDAQKKFDEMRSPKTIIKTSLVNVLQIIEAQRDWDKFNIGDIISVRHERLGIDAKAKLIEIDFNFESGDISVTIANMKEILSNQDKLIKMLYKASTSSILVDSLKGKWDNGDLALNSVYQILSSKWDSAKNAITSAINESVVIDRRGITITDPTDPDKLVRATHGVIGLSLDGGNTFSTAIDATGVYAQRLIGQILAGQNLIIDATDKNGKKTFTVDGDGVTIYGQTLKIIGDKFLEIDKPYNNGVLISTDNGVEVTRSDMRVKTTLNATYGIKIEKNTGTTLSPTWQQVFGVDSQGNLTATSLITDKIVIKSGNIELINADTRTINLDAFDVIAGTIKADYIDVDNLRIGNKNIAEIIALDKLPLSELKVGGNITLADGYKITWDTLASDVSDQITTITKDTIKTTNVIASNIVARRLQTADDVVGDGKYYRIEAEKQYIRFMEGSESDDFGQGSIKAVLGFEDDGFGTRIPIFTLGAGTGGGLNGKGRILKGVTGLVLEYYSQSGVRKYIELNDNGILMNGSEAGTLAVFG